MAPKRATGRGKKKETKAAKPTMGNNWKKVSA
jgi:hypothetical protein